jgi:hypothetical protein
MAQTDKDPRFPQPPLNRGVPQYPDPAIPNLPTLSGHVVLVEKRSVEVGAWNPPPCDGSVTYSGIDAGLYPSPLYLCDVKPTPDGLHVYLFWANDRTYSSQDAWNLSLKYSGESVSAPIVIRTYLTLRSSYATVAPGTADPSVAGALLVHQEMQELPEENPLRSLFVRTIRVYETLPGPELDGLTLSRFSVATLKKQLVVAGTRTDTGVNIVSSVVEPESVEKALIQSTIDNSPQVLVGYEYNATLNKYVTVTEQVVNGEAMIGGATPPPTPSSSDVILSCQDQMVHPYRTIRTKVSLGYSSNLPPDRTEYEDGNWSSPNLLLGLTASAVVLSNGSVQVPVFPSIQARRTHRTTLKIVTSFSYGPPSYPSPTYFEAITLDVIYEGFFLRLSYGDVLVSNSLAGETISVSGTSPEFGAFFESFVIPTSSMSAETYLAAVGTFQLISYVSKYWQANIYITKSVYALIK